MAALRISNRRLRPALILLAGIALALVAAPAALADSVRSSNWAGYAIHRGGVRFKRVTGIWRQPTTTCTGGQATYSSIWVGLGGFSETSRALEQIGSEVDCNARGKTVSSVWYELVPAASRTIRMQVRPGDMLKATVTVTGHQVQLALRDLTRRRLFTKTLHASSVDTSSAEWILETPSVCAPNSSCQVLPLADFGRAAITHASATTTRGITGPISGRKWSTTKITLASAGHHFINQGAAATAAMALPSSLSAGGGAFSITYQGTQVAQPTTAATASQSNLRTGVLVRPGRR
jgi:Peptidase A4 family